MLPPPAPVVTVAQDLGGQIKDYSARISAYLKHRVRVRIAGDCVSACTLVLGLPANRLCVTATATFQFHRAYFPDPFDPNGKIAAPDGTAYLLAHYPARVRAWIDGKGGLTDDLMVLGGAELAGLVATCR